jgi:hypothetical protein
VVVVIVLCELPFTISSLLFIFLKVIPGTKCKKSLGIKIGVLDRDINTKSYGMRIRISNNFKSGFSKKFGSGSGFNPGFRFQIDKTLEILNLNFFVFLFIAALHAKI